MERKTEAEKRDGKAVVKKREGGLSEPVKFVASLIGLYLAAITVGTIIGTMTASVVLVHRGWLSLFGL